MLDIIIVYSFFFFLITCEKHIHTFLTEFIQTLIAKKKKKKKKKCFSNVQFKQDNFINWVR
jgi:hypothetical protein